METMGRKPGLKSPKAARELLDMYFLDMRSALLETAAALDRIERAENSRDIFEDSRLQRLMRACDILQQRKINRSQEFLTLFSDPVS